MFSLICAWINDWVNNREVGDLLRHRGHYDVNVINRLVIFITVCVGWGDESRIPTDKQVCRYTLQWRHIMASQIIDTPTVCSIATLCCSTTCSLKTKYSQFDNSVVCDGTVGCHYDNLRRHRWRQSCQINDPSLSVFKLTKLHISGPLWRLSTSERWSFSHAGVSNLGRLSMS